MGLSLLLQPTVSASEFEFTPGLHAPAFGVVHMHGSRLMRAIRLKSLAVHEQLQDYCIG